MSAGHVTQMEPGWKRVASATGLILIFSLLIMLAFVHPQRAVHQAVAPFSAGGADVLAARGCPSRLVLNLYCPGCGSLRATHYLLRGDILQSLRHNWVMLFIGVPALTLYCLRLGRVALNLPSPLIRKSAGRVRAERVIMWTVVVSLFAWMVVRNIPAEALNWTRPPEGAGN